MDIEQILQTLFQQDLRYEVLIRALVEVLGSKKNPDGTPLLTVEEVNERAEKIKAEMIEQARKPKIVVPGAPPTAASTTLPTDTGTTEAKV